MTQRFCVSKERGLRSRATMRIALLILASLIVPIPILIRGSIFYMNYFDLVPWVSLLLGLISAVAIWSLFGFLIARKFDKMKPLIKVSRNLILGFFIFQLLIGSVYISGSHLKSEKLRESYTDVHPILRITIITATIFSSDIVLTDLARTREDYLRMGLRPAEFSLHFLQKTGYVHAVDIRTIGHSELRNYTLQALLWMSGFSTKRHVGTADHLHISLPIY